MGFLKNNQKANLYSNDLLYQIYKELNQIIDYINTKFENIENRDSDFENNQNNNEIKLGIKRNNSINLEENNGINLKKNKDKNENKRIHLENKNLKLKIKDFKKYSIEIAKKVIYNNKN